MDKRALSQDEFLRVKIDLPAFQLDIKSKDPRTALPELRRILEAMKIDDQVIYEEFVTQELKATLSDTFTANQSVMGVIKKLLKQEEDYRVYTTDIPTISTIDLDRKTKSVRVRPRDVQKRLVTLDTHLANGEVKQGIVHVVGKLGHEDKLLIMDNIHKRMPTAQLRSFHSEGDTAEVTVECIFFGDFPGNEEE